MDLEREITELASRVAALRHAHATYPTDAVSTVEAALAELGFAVELMGKCQEQLTAESGPAVSRRQSGSEERGVLRAVLNDLPLPLVLLDHEGHIRRINTSAANRLGSAPGYLTGKPFWIFVDLRKRAAMRSRLAAVLRDGGSASFESRLARQGWAEDVHLTLTRHDIGTEANPLVTVVMAAPLRDDTEGPAPLEAEVEDQVVVLAARRLDVLSRMTRLLLRGAGQESAGSPPALGDAAELLADAYADWVIIDVRESPTGVRRAAVAGPDGDGQRALLASLRPMDSEVPGDVLERGQPALHHMIEDETLLGRDASGVPVLSVLEASSLMCVPLRGGTGVRGALTLVRRSNRTGFRLADLGVIEEIGEHIGLTLPPPHGAA